MDEKSSFLRDVCKRLRREFGHPTGSMQGMEIANDILALFESGITDEESLLSAYRASHPKHRPHSGGAA
ncbi:hypothetical protein AAAK29_20000 [Mesorhizobium sp. CCNWLW179-1]